MHKNAVYLIERCTFKSITYSCIQGNRMPNLDMLDFKDMDDKSSFDNGCGATFQGQFWYFGDDSKVSFILYNACSCLALHTSKNVSPS